MGDLGYGSKPVIQPRYPHMLAEDADVWTRFLERFPDRFREVWYDVHCGKPVPVPADSPEWLERFANGVSRKRIDVVARVPGGYVVVEVKPYANYVALGQVLVYRPLFAEEYAGSEGVTGLVVCYVADLDVVPEFGRHGVELVEVGHPSL